MASMVARIANKAFSETPELPPPIKKLTATPEIKQ